MPALRKTAGEQLFDELLHQMRVRGISQEDVYRKAKISCTTYYRYKKCPGDIPLASLMRLFHAVGVREIPLKFDLVEVTLKTNGTYYETPLNRKKKSTQSKTIKETQQCVS